MTKGRPPNIDKTDQQKLDNLLEEIELERFFDRRLIFVVNSEKSVK